MAAPPDDDGVFVWPPLTPDQRRHAMLLAVSGLQMLQACMQSTMLAEALRRTSITRHQAESRPARQVGNSGCDSERCPASSDSH